MILLIKGRCTFKFKQFTKDCSNYVNCSEISMKNSTSTSKEKPRNLALKLSDQINRFERIKFDKLIIIANKYKTLSFVVQILNRNYDHCISCKTNALFKELGQNL